MLALLFAVATFFSTSAGGLLALRYRDRLHIFMGFAAGALVAVALLDALPESLDLLGGGASAAVRAAIFVALGFVGFNLLERSALGHAHSHASDAPMLAGHASAGGITMHSFLDGAAIGAAFHVDTRVGLTVALAVLAHDFNDGLNTVTTLLRYGHAQRMAKLWLLADALAPVAGASVTFFLVIPAGVLGRILAVFVGVFLYLAVGSLLPAARLGMRDRRLVATTLAGAAFIATVSAATRL